MKEWCIMSERKGSLTEYASDNHIDEAYQQKEYVKLQGLLDRAHPESKLAKFYRAILTENGFYPETPADEIEKLYNAAFDHGRGMIKAGIFLARRYEKNSHQKKAEHIYKIVTGEIGQNERKDEEKIDLAYAQYRLARMKESNLLFKEEVSERDLKLYDDVIAIDSNFQKGTKAHAKALYHSALIHLKYAEESKDALIMSSAKEMLKEAAGFGYKPASAELENITSRDCLSNEEYENCIYFCDEALKKDPKNINAKYTKAKALIEELGQKFNKDKYNEALQLIREVIKAQPEHASAIKFRDQILKPLNKEIARDISLKLMEKVEKEIKDDKNLWAKNITKEERRDRLAKYLSSMEEVIKVTLGKQEFIQNIISYGNNEKDIKVLMDKIWKRSKESLTDIVKNDLLLKDNSANKNIASSPDLVKQFDEKKDPKNRFKESVKDAIKEWSGVRSIDPHVKKDPETRSLLENREIFKQKLVVKMMDYHLRCVALTAPGTDLQAKIDRNWLEAIGDNAGHGAATFSAFLGPNDFAAKLGVAAAGMAIDTAVSFEKDLRQKGLFEAAKQFAAIGSTDDIVDENYSAKAKRAGEQFEYLADELLRTYGMQIDQVQNVEKLVDTASEKMLNHINNNTSFVKRASLQNFLSFIGDVIYPQKPNGNDCINLLLDGIVGGKSRKNETINLKHFGGSWKADDVFEKPAYTENGTDIYVNKNSNPSEYGARFVREIPRNAKKTEVLTEIDQQKIQESFKKHQELLHQSINHSKEENENKQKLSAENEQAKVAIKRKNIRANFVVAILKGMFGITAMGSVGAVSSLVATTGLHVLTFIPFAATLGITAALVPPIAVAIAAVGAYSLYRSVKQGFKASKELTKIDRQVVEKKQNLVIKEKSEEVDQRKELEEVLNKKREKNAKFSVLIPNTSKENKPKERFVNAVKLVGVSTKVSRKNNWLTRVSGWVR